MISEMAYNPKNDNTKPQKSVLINNFSQHKIHCSAVRINIVSSNATAVHAAKMLGAKMKPMRTGPQGEAISQPGCYSRKGLP